VPSSVLSRGVQKLGRGGLDVISGIALILERDQRTKNICDALLRLSVRVGF